MQGPLAVLERGQGERVLTALAQLAAGYQQTTPEVASLARKTKIVPGAAEPTS